MKRKHSLTLAGHRTSISLEPEFWDAFRACAERRGISIAALAGDIDAERIGRHGDTINLSAAIRLHVLADLQARLHARDE